MIQHKIIHLTTLSSYSKQRTRMRWQILTYFEPWQRLWGPAGAERIASWWGREMLAGQRSQVNWVTETVHSSSAHTPACPEMLTHHQPLPRTSSWCSAPKFPGFLLVGLTDVRICIGATGPFNCLDVPVKKNYHDYVRAKNYEKDKLKLLVWKWIM